MPEKVLACSFPSGNDMPNQNKPQSPISTAQGAFEVIFLPTATASFATILAAASVMKEGQNEAKADLMRV